LGFGIVSIWDFGLRIGDCLDLGYGIGDWGLKAHGVQGRAHSVDLFEISESPTCTLCAMRYALCINYQATSNK
jgi:hypothetical protein